GPCAGRVVGCAAAGSRPTTLTSVLDRLERRGHITRGNRPGDRRVVLIELTATGRLTADTIRQSLTEVENRALDGLLAHLSQAPSRQT
ncbi:MarR family transcriptional regulator, partial [Streptomyces sp. T-3]|nr:MarR family transcriptional regulator [Streptomyces sp. T-3]